MNNRRNLKENLTISNKQRFSIRKFSIGVASVMLGTTLYFMGGVGTSIVHADSVQEQPAQTSKLDTNSAQASSDATLAQQDSDQNQSQVSSVQNDEKTTNDQTAVKSSQQATNASAVKSNTQDSKKSVSDTNETKSVANKAQTSDQLATATSDKSSQQVAKTDTKNSNTLDIKQNKQRLADNVKLNALTDNKAQTDTQTNSKYSVTDNYPADLTNYLPSTFNNKQEYAFEWLRDQKGNNIILTTKRTGDGDVYVYQNGEGVGESVPNQPLDLDFGDGYTGTVYNDDNKSGLVQSNPVKVDEFPYPSYYDYNKLTVIYSSHAKDVKKGSYYTGISFFVPHKITQTVTYKDSNDQVIDRLTHTQDGLTGQSYTTGLPSGSDYVRADDHEYLDNITNNSSGLISEFHDGYTCTKDYHDGVKVTFTENDSEGIGAMDYVVKDHGKEVKSGILQYGNSAEYDKYAWNGWDWYKSHSYTIVNPYVPQTTNIVYQYKKLGQVITTDPSGNKTWVYYTVNYTNDQSDPIKIEPVNAKPITGYSAIVKYENKIVSDKNFMPKNLGENTYITYTANDQKATITYVDDVTKKTLASDSQDGKFDHEITFEHDPAEVIKGLAEKGYKLVSNDFKDGTKYKADDKQNEFIVHLTHDKQKVNRQDQVIETIHYVYENGSKSQPDHEQTISFTEDGIKDKVTGQIAWTPADSQKFDDVATPVITGYTPDKNSVAGSTVKFGDKDIEVTVTYHNNAQTAKITYVDDVTKKTLASDSQDGKFDHEITFEHDPAEVIKGLAEKGYKLVSNDFKDGTKYKADDKQNEFIVHLTHDKQKVNRQDQVIETIHYVYENGSKSQPDHEQTISFTEDGVKDLVTGQIDWTSATPQKFDDVTTPVITGYTPDKNSVAGSTVKFGDKDIEVTVTYHNNAQKAVITYIDDVTKKTLASDSQNGKFDHEITFEHDPAEVINGLKEKGYKLVSNNFKDGTKYKADDKQNEFIVHLTHDKQKVNRQDQVIETIHYVYENGSKSQPDHEQTISFTEDGVKDLVTGQIDWTSATPQKFDDVTTPAIVGYTPDKDKVAGSTVNFGDNDIVETVTYHNNAQTAKITYVDDVTKKTLASDSQDGKFDHEITFEHDPAEVIKGLAEKGYKLVSNDFKDGTKYKADDKQNEFIVHLTHDKQKVNRQDQVIETIHYVYENGSKSQPDHEQTISFTEDGIKDKVTGQIAWTPADSQKFDDVATPVITGYTPDKNSVAGSTVKFGDKDIEVTVTYHNNAQTAKITYVDDVTKKTLASDSQDGKFDHEITFEHDPAEVIKGLAEKGYKLVSNDFKDGTKYKADDKQNEFIVHLTHDKQKVNRQDQVIETIHYVYENGSKSQPDHEQTISFTEDGVKDLVTGQIDWTSATPQKFDDVTTPVITGYTPDKNSVAGSTVKFGDKDIEVTVTYHNNAQKAVITYIDDVTKKTLASDSQNGKFDHEITFEHDPAEVINGLKEKGYKLVSNNFKDGTKYKADDKQNEFIVHLTHDKQKVNRQDQVIETIHYVYENGSKSQPDHEQTISFTEDGVKDLVTGQIDWTSATPQKFDDVTTPAIVGYTPDKDKVAGSTVNFGDNDIVETVTYHNNAQTAKITYVDDVTKKTLASDSQNGKFDHEITFEHDPAEVINGLKEKGYKLVSNNFKDGTKYKADDKQNEFIVHLTHDKQKVNRQDQVIETIHYVYENGSKSQPDHEQTISFTEDGVKDLVTGQIDWTSATPQKFDDVTTPAIVGYTPDKDKVAGSTVNFGDNDIVETVTYHNNAQTAKITYVDDVTKKTLASDSQNGKFDHEITFEHDPAEVINGLKEKGYKLVSNNFKDGTKYKADDKQNEFIVHLTHDKQKVNRQDQVIETIHYVYENGSKSQPDHEQTISFTEDGVKDLVTGQIDWTSATPQKFDDVTTPAIVGYTPDKDKVAGSTVNFGDNDIVETVTYHNNAQTAKITYVDDVTKKTLASDSQNGKFDHEITFEHDPAEVINGLKEKGYKLVSNNFKDGTKYKADDKQNEFIVHLTHDKQKVNRQDQVIETIHYVYENGSKSQPDHEQTISFTEDGVKDLVTGQIDWTSATPQKFDDVTTPAIVGYTPDKDKVAGSTVNFGDNDIVETVTYHNNAQTAKITYVDDVTKKTLASDSQDGKFDHEITFEHDPAEVIKGLEEKGYVLVSNSFNKQTYDANNSNNVFEVHLKHGTENVSRKDDVNMTVHYVMDDGSTAPNDNKQTVSFTESGSKDLVTQKITWTPADSQKFDDVVTPVITGYTPDQDKVAGQTANFDTQDRKVTVTYSPDIQLGRINYIDDNTGKTLTHDDFSGRTNEHEDYTPIDRIQEFENKGYELVSNDYPDDGFNFDDNDQQDQVFNVHLKHGTTTVTPENPGKPGEPVDPDNPDGPKYPAGTDKTGLTDTVNRTITYVMSDGSKAPEAVHDSLSYTASKVIDKVTGEVLETETKWSANQDFKDVDSPSVKGYTPDTKTVSNKNVAHDAADITETVKYSADAQKASVTYIDDKTGKTLKVDNLNGVTNAKSGYTTKAAIDTYTGLGYTLVSDDTNGNEVVFDNDDANDQAFTVHLSHGTITVTPENPGKPGEPVDPDNPDGPKYPDGTEEYQVKRTGTQTIHYVGAGDKTPADNKQTFIFTREITFDNVTGKIISVTPWNVKSHTFGSVDTPIIPGYHADKAVAGGATVTPDDLNNVITVTYIPDGGNGDNPGSNGGGDQDDTPTPEPTSDNQPDTKLPSDNNTDKDVEKDKQDKPEEVKKARKIIKTRITKQEHIGNAEKAEPLAEQEHNDQTVASPVKNEANEPQLPQTGEANTSVIGLLGMLVAGFAAILGFESSRSRKHKN